MDVHLVDGTYELFRHFFAVPAAKDINGREIGAVRGVLTSVLSMLERGATRRTMAALNLVETQSLSVMACFRELTKERRSTYH